MDTFDGHPSSLFEPTSLDTSSFLSFSSFADLTLSPFDEPLSLWDLDHKPSTKDHNHSKAAPLQRTPGSTFSDLDSSPSPTTSPFQIISSAFEPTTPVYSGDYGIFHIPSKAGPSKLSGATSTETTPHLHHQRSISSEWESPTTPSLTSKSSIDSFASFSTGYDAYLPPSITSSAYAWDEQSLSAGSASSSKLPTPPSTATSPIRVASNPTLRTPRHPRVVKQVTSMPALKEEEPLASTPSQWFDGSLFENSDAADTTEENLLDNFDWVFGDYGLGQSTVTDNSIFSAFQNSDSTPQFDLTNAVSSVEMPQTATQTVNVQTPPADLSWLPEPTAQDVDALSFESLINGFIDPMAVMAPNGSGEESRPTTAPQVLVGGEAPGLLSVPMPGMMMRSVSSESVFQARHAPPRDLFSYAPQQMLAGPPAPQPLYTTEPSPSFIHMSQAQQQQHYPRSMPSSYAQQHPNVAGPSQINGGIRRPAAQKLAIEIQPTNFSTYAPHPSHQPLTPDSATYSSYQGQGQFQLHQQQYQPPQHPVQPMQLQQPMQQQQQQQMLVPQPIPMARGASQPIPGASANRRHVTAPVPPTTSSGKVPAHLLRAQAIVQMQEAKEEEQRQELRRQAASRRVGMAEASVMQPTTPPPTAHSRLPQHQKQQQQQIMGWEGPSHPTGTFPVLTTAPLVTVHPPAATYYANPAASSSTHRVHPPPHPGNNLTQARPMARLPSGSPGKRRQVSAPTQSSPSNGAKPAKRSPSGGAGRKKAPASGGAFSWGETTFINFTSEDAEKLLTGVAPSGSQSKRRRDEETGEGGSVENMGEEMDRSKRSRSGERQEQVQ